MASERETLSDLIFWAFDGDASEPYQLAGALLEKGVRLPARVITDPAELDTLPGRSIVVGHRGKFGTAYQLTSYVGFAQKPMWAGPYDVEKRSTSREVIEREGGVTVLREPTEEGSRG
jgi:hypothetical protein